MKRSRKWRHFAEQGRTAPETARARAQLATDVLLPLAVEVGNIGIFETDLERMVTRFSPELCGILGLPAGTEMTYDEATLLVDERDRAAVSAAVAEAVRASDKGKWSIVHRVRHADGTARWISVHGRRLYRETAEGLCPVYSIGTVIDITQLKEIEAALRESELRLRLALDAAKMGTFEADITANEARIDEQEAVLLGLPEGTRVVSTDEMRKRIPLEDLDASDAKKSRLTEQHEAYHHEFRLTMRDGSVRWLSAYADVRENRIFGVNFDVTQRKLAESALHESEARLRVATSGAALGVFEWDPITDQAVWENDRIYEIFGRSRGDGPLSKREFIANYLHPDDAPELETSLNEAMRSEGNWRTTCRIKRQDGTRRWLQMDGRFEKAAPGKLPRLIGVITDITERKRLEERAERLSDRLLTIQEEERRNIAQELHDSTVQHLVAASLMTTTLRASPRSEKDKKSWNALEDSLGEAMKELRTFSYLMHPPVLHAQGLYLSLQHYIDGFADRSGLVTKLTANRKGDKFPVRLQRPVFRIVQEALANAYRHASASQVSVELRRIGGLLHVIVADNGRGIERNFERRQHPSRPPGVGIRGIRMRLNRLGGRLRISQPRAGGTRIHAVLPVGNTFAHRTARRR
ncbi:MAG: PAS domain S-box protein [Alphaproteobacteria bacterium]|nr:MAG: PAS domain S-box protein [Alphaproteobacteria bacterium]